MDDFVYICTFSFCLFVLYAIELRHFDDFKNDNLSSAWPFSCRISWVLIIPYKLVRHHLLKLYVLAVCREVRELFFEIYDRANDENQQAQLDCFGFGMSLTALF